MGSGALPLHGSPEIPMIFNKEEGHSCFKSCWVKCRVLAGCWWLWRGQGRGGQRRQIWGWVCAGLGFGRAAGGEGNRVMMNDAVALRLFQGQHSVLSGLEGVLLTNRTEELNVVFLGCNRSCLSRVPALLKSLPLL